VRRLKRAQNGVEAGHGECLLRLAACLGSEKLHGGAVRVLRVHETDEARERRLVGGRGVLGDDQGDAGVDDAVLSLFALHAAATRVDVECEVAFGHLLAVPVGGTELDGGALRAGDELLCRPHGADGVQVHDKVREDFHYLTLLLPVRRSAWAVEIVKQRFCFVLSDSSG